MPFAACSESSRCAAGTSDYDGRTAAHLAASEGRTEILKYLISKVQNSWRLHVCFPPPDGLIASPPPGAKGANPNPRDRFGGTPLDDAIRHRQWEAQLVLRNGGGCMSRQAEAMCQASARGDIEAIRTYLTNGANPNEGAMAPCT